MNYIKRLEAENTTNRNRMAAAEDAILDLIVYLHSSKFSQDTTVQTADVLARLGNVRDQLLRDDLDSAELQGALTRLFGTN